MSAFDVLILTTPLHGSSVILWVDTQITGSCSNSCPHVFTTVILPANYIKTSTNMAPINRFPPFAPKSVSEVHTQGSRQAHPIKTKVHVGESSLQNAIRNYPEDECTHDYLHSNHI